MKKLVLLVAVVFAVGIMSSSASVKVVNVKNDVATITIDKNVSPEGEKDTKKETKTSEAKSTGCAGEKSASAEKAGCGGEKSASAEKAGCGGEKSASAEKAGCGGEKTAEVEKK